MKFCPKCSLKIKGDLTYCPLCKVELLSCADDEEITSQVTDEEQPDSLAADLDNTISSIDDLKDGGSTNGLRESVQENTTDNIYHTDEDDDPKVRLKKLDISLAELKNSLASPPEYSQDIETESSRFELQFDQFVGDLESVKNSLKDLHDKINKLSEECRISMKISEDNKSKITKLALYAKGPISSFEEVQAQSNPLFGEIEVPEEKIKFPESEGEGFETNFEPSLSPLSKEDISQPERVKKSKLPLIIILILAATIISLWCGFYFLNSHEQSIQKENIPKRSDIASVPKSATPVKLFQKRITKPAAKIKIEEKDIKKPEISGGKSSQNKKSASIATVKTKNKPSRPEKSKKVSSPSKKTSGYTINVGSFKDKKRAQNFTKKLLEKGYPAFMFPSNKNKWYRVKIGAFSTFKEASTYAATLNKKENFSIFITKID